MMDNPMVKRVVLVAAALVVVAGAAAAVIAVLGGVAPRQAGGATAVAGRFDVDQTKSLPVDGVQRISVEVVSSDITVTESADGAASARLYGTASSNRSVAVPELIAETRGSAASFRVDYKSVNMVAGWYRSDLKLELAIPKGYHGALVVHGVSAKVTLPAGRTFNDLEITTVSGDVDLGACTAGSFRCHTVSGSLAAREVATASADLGSTSGRMTVGGLTGDLVARTVSGDLDLAWTSFNGSIDVSTTSGRVTLAIPAGVGFRLDASSTSGRITSDHDVTVRESTSGPGRHSLFGEVGSGAGSVRVRTVSGEIRIAK
jgi:hypothetical protein